MKSVNLNETRELQVVRGGGSSYEDGIANGGVDSVELVAQDELFAKLEVIGPHVEALAHMHSTASFIYILQGTVTVNFGVANASALTETDVVVAGDSIFIPPFVAHQPLNTTDETVVCVVVRNAREEEIIPLASAS